MLGAYTTNPGTGAATYQPATWFEAWGAGVPGRVADLTAAELSRVNATKPTDLRETVGTEWPSDLASYPMVSMTFYLPASEKPYRYGLRWSLSGQPDSVQSMMPVEVASAVSTVLANGATVTIPTDACKITSTVAVGATFALTRQMP